MNTLFKTITSSPAPERENSVLSFQNHKDLEHKILIEGLELTMFIGILPKERESRQRVLIDLEVFLEPKSSYNDDIGNTVSYADLIADMQRLSTGRHFDLVESLAEDISRICFSHAEVQKIKVSVKKPDIIVNTRSVGFSMVRSKV